MTFLEGTALVLVIALLIVLVGVFRRGRQRARRGREELRKVEDRFERAFRLGPAPMAISRLADGTFVDMNEMYLDYFGYAREEIVGRTSRDLQIISDAEREKLVEGLRAHGFVRNVLLHTHTRTGDARDVLFSSETMDLGGEPHMLSILYDITERLAAEKALGEREAELAEAQEIAKLGDWTLDLDSNIGRWSAAFAHIHGRDPGWRSAPVSEYLSLVAQEDRPGIEESIRTIVATGRSTTFDYRVILSGGETRWMNARMDLVRNEAGKPCMIRGISQDITDRIRWEGQLRQSQKLDAVGQLAGGIAHDLNNILAVITGHITMAAEDLPADHPVQDNLAAVKKAGRRAADLVRRILSVSSPRVPEGRVVTLPAVMEETIGLLRASLPPMIEIRSGIEGAIPPVKGDSTQIHQVLMNLATNAAHAMEDKADGVLTVDLKVVHVDAATAAVSPDLRERPYARISIQDNGRGMDRRTQERIFEPFFTTKAVGKGTGLGLAIVSGIVRGHGGAITVYSETGRGTTFRVYLPLAGAADAPTPELSAEEVTPGRGEHILCVDDEPDLLDVVSALLVRMGYRVTKYADSRQCLSAFEASPDAFDLLMTDHAMPGLTGLSLAERALAIRPGLPIIVTSGIFTDKDVQDAERLGAHRLDKPGARDELSRLLRKLLP